MVWVGTNVFQTGKEEYESLTEEIQERILDGIDDGDDDEQIIQETEISQECFDHIKNVEMVISDDQRKELEDLFKQKQNYETTITLMKDKYKALERSIIS